MEFYSALWTFPAILLAAILIAWGAECGQFFISQGLALAILAWLQTLPEFAVEAAIAHQAALDPNKIHLITANFTGSLRLLVGVGWPLVYFTMVIFNWRKNNTAKPRLLAIKLEDEHCVEVLALLLPLFYFVIIYLKGTLNIIDGLILLSFYVAYLYILRKLPPQEEEKIEDVGRIPKKIMKIKGLKRAIFIIGFFVVGGLVLYFFAEPFLQSLLAMAVALGVSSFVFVQWVAPFLSEFPEKVSAFYWARTVKKAHLALMNMVSSNINQWTVLVCMIPIVYGLSLGRFAPINFDEHQRVEILLTIVQSFLGFLFLASMDFNWYEAVGLFVLWLIQFVKPSFREEITVIYGLWIGYELLLILFRRRELPVFKIFVKLLKKHPPASREVGKIEKGD